jgi:murein DD-endopeptidase MepM/ murein hydrolase activator NlpD
MAWRPSHYLATGTLAAAGLVWAVRDAWPGRRPLLAPAIRVERAYVESERALGHAETLGDLLARGGIVGRDRTAFLAAATDLPVRRLRPGLVVQFRRLQTDSVADRVTVRVSPERRVRLSRGAIGWQQATEAIPWTVAQLRIGGVIGTSLYEALDKAVPDRWLPLAERHSLAWALADVYDWQVDFTRDVHPGDRFRVLFERLESPEGEYRFGRVLAAQVDVAKVPTFAFSFTPDANQPAGFYDERGRSLRRAFLRAPLQFRRVSSGFGVRYHPLLHIWRNHEGVDFAAPYGAPVRATADGIVMVVGRGDPGYGNLIELRHASGIRTRYGHLSAFARGLRVGDRVQQGETIGYVGSTGLSTGPHLHYEFLVNGRPANPRRKDMGAGTPVPRNLRAAYDSVRAHLLAELDPPPPVTPAASAAIPPRPDSTVAARDD